MSSVETPSNTVVPACTDLDDVALCIEVMAAQGCLSIVRVPLDADSRKAFARRCLDAGAVGILFPNIRNAEEAREAITNCYYPNESFPGTRGYGYGGCNGDGARFAEYAAFANERSRNRRNLSFSVVLARVCAALVTRTWLEGS